MNIGQKIHLLKERFVIRDDVYATQWFDPNRGSGYYKQTTGVCPGNCPRGACPHIKNKPLTSAVLKAHIEHQLTIGVYQLDARSHLKWLCFDVDIAKKNNFSEEEAIAAAQEQTKRLAKDLQKCLVPFLVEQSGSRGYHIWVFFSEPVKATDVRALGMWFAGRNPSLPGITIEVYPKQTMNAEYGNLVKMPLGIHQKTKNPCLFVNSSWEPRKDQWETLKNVQTIPKANLIRFLEGNNIDVHTFEQVIQDTSTDGVGKITPPCFTRMMREGFQSGYVDVGLFRLGAYFRDRGLPLEMAEAAASTLAISSSDDLTKEEQIDAKFASAYAKNYSPLPCNEPLLDHFCSSSCRFFPSKVKNRPGATMQTAIGTISRD